VRERERLRSQRRLPNNHRQQEDRDMDKVYFPNTEKRKEKETGRK